MRRQLVTLSLAAALGSAEGCGGATRGPTEPTVPSGPAYTYTISGTITEYHGGPISGVSVTAAGYRASDGRWTNETAATITGPQGHYSLSGQFSGDVGLVVYKTGYVSAWKYNLPAPESTVDFILHPSVAVSARGDTLAGTIRGDEYTTGDDVLFGGLCSRAPCKVVQFKEYSGSPLVEVRLRFHHPAVQAGTVGDGSTRLALYVTREDLESPPPFRLPDRYCCSYSSNESVIATFGVPYLNYVAIAYELEEAGPPGPADSQPFELTVRPIR